ncbi:MAG: ScpA family protein [Parvibaculaceae bacterium]|nr:ScpA family protein [Parvibaculaceae bacterium]
MIPDAPSPDTVSNVIPFQEGRPIAVPAAEGEALLIVDLDGYEGPLDVLLALARNQKVDLTRISILALAEQYLVFINQARHLELDLAADYLVMAAWLAYLKSKLLLPPPDEEEGPSGEEMAARLAFQLQRLQAMRKAVEDLSARKRLGVELFQRGMPEGIRVVKTSLYDGNLYDILKAYSEQRVKNSVFNYQPKKLAIVAIEAARRRLEGMLGMMIDWSRIDVYLPKEYTHGPLRRSALASTVSAMLELAKDGEIELDQAGAFGPLYVRKRVTPRPEPVDNDDEN